MDPNAFNKEQYQAAGSRRNAELAAAHTATKNLGAALEKLRDQQCAEWRADEGEGVELAGGEGCRSLSVVPAARSLPRRAPLLHWT